MMPTWLTRGYLIDPGRYTPRPRPTATPLV